MFNAEGNLQGYLVFHIADQVVEIDDFRLIARTIRTCSGGNTCDTSRLKMRGLKPALRKLFRQWLALCLWCKRQCEKADEENATHRGTGPTQGFRGTFKDGAGELAK